MCVFFLFSFVFETFSLIPFRSVGGIQLVFILLILIMETFSVIFSYCSVMSISMQFVCA